MSSTEINPYAAPKTSVVDEPVQHGELAQPIFFPVSATKLIVMSTFTFGLYQLYWFYQNWRHVKQYDKSNIVPAMRAFFGFFFCYSLFGRVKEEADDLKIRSIPAGWLAAGWMLITLLSRLPEPFWLVSLLAPVFLLPVQSCVNEINQHIAPGHDSNSRFGAWNVVWMVVGSLFWLLVLVGLFYHPAATQ
jgi:hypothetical protein